jgi:hypothetical protein
MRITYISILADRHLSIALSLWTIVYIEQTAENGGKNGMLSLKTNVASCKDLQKE